MTTLADPEVPPAGSALELPPSQGADLATPFGWAVAVGAFLALCAVLPELASSVNAPKAAVVLVLGAAGLPALVGRALGSPGWRRSATEPWAARAALAFVAAGALSTAFSTRPVLALVGLYNQFDGWLFMVVLVGCWALGTTLGRPDRHLLESSLIAAALVNTAAALLEQVVGLEHIGITTYNGQPTGLLGNPVYLGALLAATAALLGTRFVTDPRRWWLPTAAVAVGLGVGGERLPALAALAVAAVEVLFGWRRDRRPDGDGQGTVRGALFAAVTVVGLLAGSLLGKIKGGLGVTTHFAQSTATETYSQRFDAWSAALHAIAHRPLIGYGPGQFLSAATPYWTLADERTQPGSYFSDAHNLVIQYATTTGLLGAACLLAFVALALHRRRGRLVGFALVLLVIQLAEPVNIALTPVAFLALGAAALAPAQTPAAPWQRPHWLGPVSVALAALAAVPAVLFLVGDAALTRAGSQYSVAQDAAALSSAGTAERFLAPWPQPASQLATIHLYQSLAGNQEEARQAAHWAQVAADREPGNGPLLLNLADMQLSAGQVDAARASATRALAWSPVYWAADNLLGAIAYHTESPAAADVYYRRSLAIEPDQPAIRRVLDGTCPPQLPGSHLAPGALQCLGAGH